MEKIIKIVLLILVILGVAGYYLYRQLDNHGRSALAMEWLRNPEAHPDWAIQAGQRCGDAPFSYPTHGYIGYIWDDSFRPGHHHSGLDIFGGKEPGVTPVLAAYDGYLTRMPDWISTVIVRVPQDPLHPERQIWLYYTHMADEDGNSFVAADFPPGTSEVPIKAGTLLGHQGNYSGTAGNPTGVHLHFSIVQDDGKGHFKDERDINNTLDPTPYLGIELNSKRAGQGAPVCTVQ